MTYYSSHTENEVYYYHGDLCGSRAQSQACLSYAEMQQSVRSKHLGSASWITDYHGDPVQHLQYLPYGEPHVDQHPYSYQERFTFTGKERDEETGYGYFGARYMDHELMTMWLSVDPMADKYTSVSPYAYCAWNPLKLVDPDGEDIYRLDISNGSLKLYQKTKDKTDKIIAGLYEGIGRAKIFKETGNISFSKGILDGAKRKDYSKSGFTSTGGNQEEAIDVAKFISYNTHVEVSGAGFTSSKNVEDAEVFGWSGNSLTTSNNPGEYSAPDGCATDFHFHVHPENEKADGRFGRGVPSKKDYLHAQKTISSYGEDNFYIISPQHGVTRYNHLGVLPKALGVPKSLIKHQ